MIELKNISKIYHNQNNNAMGLRGVDLSLGNTGLVFIVGHSGSGKSTLINILSGLDVPSGGQMHINGVDIEKFHGVGLDGYRTNYVGMVFQDNNLLEHLTLAQNVALSVEIMGRKVDTTEVHEIFERLGIRELENRYPHEVSGGQAQRAAIARVLIKKPKILFTDELTSNLDNIQRDEVYKLLKELSTDVLVVATTHQTEMVDRFADRVITLDQGRIKKDVITNKKLKDKKPDDQEGIFRFEKTRLPFKQSLKLGWGHFKINRFRTAFMITLAILAISLFAMTSTLSTINESRAVINSFAAGNQPYISFRNNDFAFQTNHRDEWFSYGRNPMQILRNSALVHQVSPSLTAEISSTEIFGVRHIATIGPTAGGDINIFGQNILHGEWPGHQHATGRSIVVSDFVAAQIVAAVPLLSLADVVGTLHQGFTIIGIYQTDFLSYLTMSPLMLRADLNETQTRRAVYLMQNNWVTAFAHPNIVSNLKSNRMDIGGSDLQSAFGFFLTDTLSGARPRTATEHAPLYRLIASEGITIARGAISQPMGTVRITQGLSSAIDAGTHLRFSITHEVQDLGSAYAALHNNSLPISNHITYHTHRQFNLSVVNTYAEPGRTMYLSHIDFDAVIGNLIAPGTAFIVANYGTSQLMRVLNRMPPGSFATYADSGSVTNFTQNFRNVQGVLLAMAIVFGMLSIFLIFSFIMMSVRLKRKNIAILRSMGAKTADIITIFLIEALAFAAFIITGALILSMISMAIGNAAVRNATQNSLMLFNAPAWFYVAVLGFTLLLIIGTYLIPSTHYARHRRDKGVITAVKQKSEN